MDVESNNLAQDECQCLASLPSCPTSFLQQQPVQEDAQPEQGFFSLSVYAIEKKYNHNSLTDMKSKLPNLTLRSRLEGGAIFGNVPSLLVDMKDAQVSMAVKKQTIVTSV